MAILSSDARRVKTSAKRAYYAHNSRNVAGLRFGDTLRSVRGRDGILRSANAIAWDAGVIERAAADGVTQLEVSIRDGSTYKSTIDNLLEHGRMQYRFGRQWVMSLRFYSIDGRQPEAETSGPVVAQLSLFGEVSP
ncbi:MAG: hypothetical protein R3C14_22730 [Caldilineaceae bacterium]